ncbi:MAG: hypothetical protein V1744_03525 [Candidatus Altiarchaeota archaeon]
MKNKKTIRGVSVLSREKILETKDLTPEMRLNWLQEANEFVHLLQTSGRRISQLR